jgi:hypothetical protein
LETYAKGAALAGADKASAATARKIFNARWIGMMTLQTGGVSLLYRLGQDAQRCNDPEPMPDWHDDSHQEIPRPGPRGALR